VSKPVEDAPPEVTALGNGRYLVVDEARTRLAYAVAGRDTWVFLDGRAYVISTATTGGRIATRDDSAALAAPMPATVVKIEVTPGQDVTRDTVLIMLEAMKMELPIKAPHDGRVRAINCRVGDIVQPGVALLELSSR
jgi:3-methylcrotonyl-CoA carboxylase alpha subunit